MRLAVLATLAVFAAPSSNPCPAQCSEVVFRASDAAQKSDYGHAVAIAGDVAVIGAPKKETVKKNAGAAYVLERHGGVWREVAILESTTPKVNGQFGGSVDVDGDVVVIGSVNDNEVTYGGAPAGAAFVFRRVGGQWRFEAKLLPQPGQRGFGISVAVSGDIVVVGAYVDFTLPYQDGCGIVHRRRAGAWSFEQKLIPSGGQSQRVGYGVDIDGDRALVGAYTSPGPAGPAVGAAFVFRWTGAAWTEEAKLQGADGQQEDNVGYGVALDGWRAAIGGDSLYAANPGKVYVFDFDGAAWAETAKISLGITHFGRAVALDGETLAVSEFHHSIGTAHVFRRRPWGWDHLTTIGNPNGPLGEWGKTVAVDGGTVIAGFEFDDTLGDKAGLARAVPVPPDVGTTTCAGVPNSTGDAGELVLSGSLDVQDECFHATALRLPPQRSATLLASQGPDQVPMFGGGQGTLCLAMPFYVVPGTASTSDPSGTYAVALALASVGPPPGPQPGETWYFQVLYRDLLAATDTTNLTSAVAVLLR